MSKHSHGVYFIVLLRKLCSLDQITQYISESMHCSFTQTYERGIIGDYIGEVLGMKLEIYVSQDDNAINDEGTLFVFSGGTQFDEGTNVLWTDISEYIVQILRDRTGFPWRLPIRSDL